MLIQDIIYEIRGQKVMLDFDLANLYGVETKALNQSVKRNIERFPVDFMFQLTKGEFEIWKSQTVTSNSVLKSDDQKMWSQFVTAKQISTGCISLALSELQAKEPPKSKRNPIGFR